MKALNFSRLPVYVDQEVHSIYEQLTSRSTKKVGDYPFETMKDLFLTSACIGAKKNRFLEVKHTKEIFDATLFNPKTEVPILLSLAFHKSKDIEDLSEERKVLDIAQGWANGGIQIVKEQLINNPGRPLFNLVDLLWQEIVNVETTQKRENGNFNGITNERDYELTCDKSIKKFNNSDCRDLFYILEFELKQFISKKLQNLSKDWWKVNVPDEIRKRAEKRKIDRENPYPGMGKQDRPLIDYLDFPDLKVIITLKSNWEPTFMSVFKRQDIIQVKLDEIAPFRNDIAHNRDLQENDREIFVSNVRQILRIIRN